LGGDVCVTLFPDLSLLFASPNPPRPLSSLFVLANGPFWDSWLRWSFYTSRPIFSRPTTPPPHRSGYLFSFPPRRFRGRLSPPYSPKPVPFSDTRFSPFFSFCSPPPALPPHVGPLRPSPPHPHPPGVTLSFFLHLLPPIYHCPKPDTADHCFYLPALQPRLLSRVLSLA